jgi:hypothetical protein
MRLTLRTLLAYLDDVLDPADKEELAQKIQTSDFAEDLVHRTRDTVRRLRLSAPQVVGHGMGLDPNSVAEYLDNVMPPDAVGDFERICLESDVHLAEAAACHHVLTMILGQPADVDPIARQRMYTIATEAGERKQLRIEPAHKPLAAAAAAVHTAAAAAPVVPAQPRSVEIPEYLQTGPWWRSWPAIAGLAALVVVGIGILIASGAGGWFKHDSSLAELSSPNTAPPAAANNEESAPPAAADASPAQSQNGMTAPVATDTAPPSTATASQDSPPPPLTPGIEAPAPQAIAAQPPAATKAGETDRYAVTRPAGENPTAPTPPAVVVTPPANTEQPANNTGAANPPAAANPVPAPGNGVATSSTTPVPSNSAVGSTTPDNAAPGSAANGNVTANIPTKGAANLPDSVPIPPQTNLPPANAPPATGVATTTPSPPADANLTPAAPAPPAANLTTGGKPKTPAGPPEVGTYLGGKTVLLRFNAKTGTWFRVEPRAAVVAGERVLALPEFRPKIALISGLHLDLSGGTQVVVGNRAAAKPSEPESKVDAAAAPAATSATPPAPPANASPGSEIADLQVNYGRIVLINPSNNDNRVRLKLGPYVGEAQLARKATLGIEVEGKHVPGQDPQQIPAPIECKLFAPDGGVVWKDAAGEKTIDKPSRWTLTTTGATDPVAQTQAPDWIDHEPIVQLSEQRYGAPVVESTLVSNVPVDTQLLEIFQTNGRKEVKSLVARSSIHVGLFVPFIDALRDSEQKANWKMQIDALRAAMALSPESAAKVKLALEDQRGKPAAKDLYEMLCGYSVEQVGKTPEQLKAGTVVPQLIDWLEQDSLDYRVLAAQNLWEITGKRYMPNPASTLAERTRNVKYWRAQLEKGELKPVAAPAQPQ